jgi:hypothetical protein
MVISHALSINSVFASAVEGTVSSQRVSEGVSTLMKAFCSEILSSNYLASDYIKLQCDFTEKVYCFGEG